MACARFGVTWMLLALSLAAVCTAPAAAGPFSQIIAFGDSLSDTGNDFILSAGTSPAPPYYQGRFSNGPIWLDQLATKLGVADPRPSLGGGTNYAYGGATASSLFLGVPDLGQQVQAYLQASPKADPKALYTVLAGANDFFGGVNDASIPANAVDAALSTLIGAGAKHILVSNLPPQGITPDIRSQGAAAVKAINALDAQFNADLLTDVAALRAANPGVVIDVLDLYSLANSVVNNPAAYGFTNITDEGINAPPGTNLSQYLFWDDVHPTTVAHGYIADAAFLRAVPEPGSLTLAGVCGLALAARRWTRRRTV
jgi:phospholipase/lecithinase/hemolysin